QHGQVAVSAHMQRKQNVLVPEDEYFLAVVAGVDGVNRRIVKGHLVVERRHPGAHRGRAQQAADLYRELIEQLHFRLPCSRSVTPPNRSQLSISTARRLAQCYHLSITRARCPRILRSPDRSCRRGRPSPTRAPGLRPANERRSFAPSDPPGFL